MGDATAEDARRCGADDPTASRRDLHAVRVMIARKRGGRPQRFALPVLPGESSDEHPDPSRGLLLAEVAATGHKFMLNMSHAGGPKSSGKGVDVAAPLLLSSEIEERWVDVRAFAGPLVVCYIQREGPIPIEAGAEGGVRT